MPCNIVLISAKVNSPYISGSRLPNKLRFGPCMTRIRGFAPLAEGDFCVRVCFVITASLPQIGAICPVWLFFSGEQWREVLEQCLLVQLALMGQDNGSVTIQNHRKGQR